MRVEIVCQPARDFGCAAASSNLAMGVAPGGWNEVLLVLFHARTSNHVEGDVVLFRWNSWSVSAPRVELRCCCSGGLGGSSIQT